MLRLAVGRPPDDECRKAANGKLAHLVARTFVMPPKEVHTRRLTLLPAPLVLVAMAAACGAETPTGETVVEVVEGSLLSVAGDGQVGSLGHPLSDSLIVKVADPSGNGLRGVAVRWFLSNAGMVSPADAVTDSAGLAKVLWTLGRETGIQTATEQRATARASVSGVYALTFRATTPSLVPLTDMGASTYFGFPGGLYPGGNVMPQAHADAGQAFAAAVEPLDANGNPSTDGKYVLLAIGHSNTMLTFCNTDVSQPCPTFTFIGQAIADPDVDMTNLAIVRGAGARAEFWESPTSSEYDKIRGRLSPLGLSEQQVQVVYAELATRVPTITLPDPDAQAHNLVRQMGNIVRAFRSHYPNLRLVFLSSSIYLGYVVTVVEDDITRHDREPRAYETGFAMKWLIQAQIDQMASGGTIVDARAGDLNYNTAVPWIGWGPYLWADGVNPRSDGLSWSRGNFNPDEVHLNPEGREKAASLLLTFFKTSPQARCWFLTGETC